MRKRRFRVIHLYLEEAGVSSLIPVLFLEQP